MWRQALLLVLMATGAIGCDLEPCLADDEGCAGRATLTLVPCDGSDDAVALGELLAGPVPEPQTVVTVSGPLRRESGMCSQLGCATTDGCCNGCGAALVLSADPAPQFASPTDLRLRGSLQGVELSCGGDESLLCCPTPTDGRPVVVTGELTDEGVSLDGPLYGLQVSSLCRGE
jgi:hypothetical protein